MSAKKKIPIVLKKAKVKILPFQKLEQAQYAIESACMWEPDIGKVELVSDGHTISYYDVQQWLNLAAGMFKEKSRSKGEKPFYMKPPPVAQDSKGRFKNPLRDN